MDGATDKDAVTSDQAAIDALEKLEVEDAEPDFIDIVVISPGTITGKGLVPVGSRHTIPKGAYSVEWMVPDAKTADGIMQIDPRHRYTVNLSDMKPEELKVLMLRLDIKTKKQKMKRADVEKLITARLVEIAEADADAEE